MKNILVTIPTYNEVDNIDKTVETIEYTLTRLRNHEFKLLIIDDESPDNTAKHVRVLQNKYHNVELLTGKKEGLGRAYIRGFEYALRSKQFDVIIMMDADLSHNPKDIPALLKAIDEGYDYVIGSRYAQGGAIPGSWPLFRIIISRTANYIVRKLVSGNSSQVLDATGGFKAIRGVSLEQINLDSLKANGYIFQVSLLHAFIQQGLRVREIPITFTNRQFGNSKLRLRDVLEFIYRAYKLSPNAPIQRFIRFGFVGACGTVVNLAVLSIFIDSLHVDALISIAVAIELSIIFNFLLNQRYTFKGYGAYISHSQREPLRMLLLKLIKFNFGALGGATISFTIFTIMFKFVNINYVFSDLVAIVTSMSWNYWISTRFIWKAIDKTENIF